ncbi:hypothetical protein SCYAM73S_00705 [Streptomyces cyaneofuscatus]
MSTASCRVSVSRSTRRASVCSGVGASSVRASRKCARSTGSAARRPRWKSAVMPSARATSPVSWLLTGTNPYQYGSSWNARHSPAASTTDSIG